MSKHSKNYRQKELKIRRIEATSGRLTGRAGLGPVRGVYNASHSARIKDDADCKSCGNCENLCPTTAMKLINKKVSFNKDKCIGCGQCAYQCRQNNIEMYPNEPVVYLPILKKSEARVTA